jgi:hypothetical protein
MQFPATPFILIGNKNDLDRQRALSRDDAMKAANNLRATYIAP